MSTTRRRRAGEGVPWDVLRESLWDLPDGIALLGPSGGVEYLNLAGRRLLDLGEEELPPSVDRWHRRFKSAATPLAPLRVLNGKDASEEILEAASKAGLWVHLVAHALRDASGTRRGVLVRLRDVSEREERRRSAELELGRRTIQRTALLRLLRSDGRASKGLRAALRDLVHLSGNILGVARCGLWLLDEDGRSLRCEALSAGKEEEEPLLEALRHPAYLAAISDQDGAPIGDVDTDPRARELRSSYLRPKGIGAMMDAPLYVEGRLRGVICHEHVGGPRDWADDERTFALATAAVAARMVGDDERRRLGAALRDSERRVEALEGRAGDAGRFSRLLGRSPAMAEAVRRLRQAARSDVTLLIRGESGTGKELAARAVHEHGARHAGPFVPVNCAAIPESLLESELFGHAKGAFTGALQDRPGFFQEAHRGTLFLDEIGEMPKLLQAKVLRALQEREVRPVGASRTVRVDLRIVAATNRDLEEEVEAGRMREDFFYRIRVFEVRLPPLRERPEDLPGLVDQVLEELCAASGRPRPALDPEAYRRLLAHSWPGNVRELRNALEYALVGAPTDRIRSSDLPRLGRPREGRRPAPSRRAEDAAGAERIVAALRAEGGHRARAAARLGISRVTLWHRLKALGIDDER
jgi:DNA-binding NtrC family response regulator